MVYPRDVLNKLKWAEGESLDEAIIWYTHRGAPGNCIRISGSSVKSLGSMFFETREAEIPYHRILRVDYRGKTLFAKDSSAADLG